METLAHDVTHLLRNLIVYEANGGLIVIYALLAQWALVLALPCAAGAFALDLSLAGQLSLSPRPGTPAPAAAARLTLAVAALWTAIALAVPQPVPALGLSMWAVTLGAAWLIPAARPHALWRGKMALLTYSLANLGLLAFMQLTANLSPEQWAALLGSPQAALQTIDQGRGIVQTLATVAIWYAIPAGYIGWAVKEFALNQGSLVAPGQTAADVVHAIRTRGGQVR